MFFHNTHDKYKHLPCGDLIFQPFQWSFEIDAATVFHCHSKPVFTNYSTVLYWFPMEMIFYNMLLPVTFSWKFITWSISRTMRLCFSHLHPVWSVYRCLWYLEIVYPIVFKAVWFNLDNNSSISPIGYCWIQFIDRHLLFFFIRPPTLIQNSKSFISLFLCSLLRSLLLLRTRTSTMRTYTISSKVWYSTLNSHSQYNL